MVYSNPFLTFFQMQSLTISKDMIKLGQISKVRDCSSEMKRGKSEHHPNLHWDKNVAANRRPQ